MPKRPARKKDLTLAAVEALVRHMSKRKGRVLAIRPTLILGWGLNPKQLKAMMRSRGFEHRFVMPSRGHEGNVFCRDCGDRLTGGTRFSICRRQWKVFDAKKR